MEAQSTTGTAGKEEVAVGKVDWFGKDIAPVATRLWSEIKALDLAEHIAELEVLGLTVIPPEKFTTRDFVGRLRSALLDMAEIRFGERPDLDHGGPTEAVPSRAVGQMIRYVLLENPIFEQAVMNPAVLALTTYMLGENAILSTCEGLIKPQCDDDFFLHCDAFFMPAPLPMVPQTLNLTWAMTDYTRANGALCYVPGSHRYCRQPRANEGWSSAVPVEAPAGSLIVWGGNTWHGALRRTAPGQRLSLLMFMMRPGMRPQEDYRSRVTAEILDRNPPRFRKLMGFHVAYGWQEKGPDPRFDGGASVGSHYWD